MEAWLKRCRYFVWWKTWLCSCQHQEMEFYQKKNHFNRKRSFSQKALNHCCTCFNASTLETWDVRNNKLLERCKMQNHFVMMWWNFGMPHWMTQIYFKTFFPLMRRGSLVTYGYINLVVVWKKLWDLILNIFCIWDSMAGITKMPNLWLVQYAACRGHWIEWQWKLIEKWRHALQSSVEWWFQWRALTWKKKIE